MNNSFLFYSTLRSLCELHSIEVQNVSRRTLHNWKSRGVAWDHIDLLCYRLIYSNLFTRDALSDIALSCGFSGRLTSLGQYPFGRGV